MPTSIEITRSETPLPLQFNEVPTSDAPSKILEQAKADRLSNWESRISNALHLEVPEEASVLCLMQSMAQFSRDDFLMCFLDESRGFIHYNHAGADHWVSLDYSFENEQILFVDRDQTPKVVKRFEGADFYALISTVYCLACYHKLNDAAEISLFKQIETAFNNRVQVTVSEPYFSVEQSGFCPPFMLVYLIHIFIKELSEISDPIKNEMGYLEEFATQAPFLYADFLDIVMKLRSDLPSWWDHVESLSQTRPGGKLGSQQEKLFEEIRHIQTRIYSIFVTLERYSSSIISRESAIPITPQSSKKSLVSENGSDSFTDFYDRISTATHLWIGEFSKQVKTVKDLVKSIHISSSDYAYVKCSQTAQSPISRRTSVRIYKSSSAQSSDCFCIEAVLRPKEDDPIACMGVEWLEKGRENFKVELNNMKFDWDSHIITHKGVGYRDETFHTLIITILECLYAFDLGPEFDQTFVNISNALGKVAYGENNPYQDSEDLILAHSYIPIFVQANWIREICKAATYSLSKLIDSIISENYQNFAFAAKMWAFCLDAEQQIKRKNPEIKEKESIKTLEEYIQQSESKIADFDTEISRLQSDKELQDKHPEFCKYRLEILESQKRYFESINRGLVLIQTKIQNLEIENKHRFNDISEGSSDDYQSEEEEGTPVTRNRKDPFKEENDNPPSEEMIRRFSSEETTHFWGEFFDDQTESEEESGDRKKTRVRIKRSASIISQESDEWKDWFGNDSNETSSSSDEESLS